MYTTLPKVNTQEVILALILTVLSDIQCFKKRLILRSLRDWVLLVAQKSFSHVFVTQPIHSCIHYIYIYICSFNCSFRRISYSCEEHLVVLTSAIFGKKQKVYLQFDRETFRLPQGYWKIVMIRLHTNDLCLEKVIGVKSNYSLKYVNLLYH